MGQVELKSASHSGLNADCGARVLTTGGLGFIGAAIARRLVALRAEVLLVDIMISDSEIPSNCSGSHRRHLHGSRGVSRIGNRFAATGHSAGSPQSRFQGRQFPQEFKTDCGSLCAQ
jgi:hypothetical protein